MKDRISMKQLIKKEIVLVTHPTAIIFLALSAMLLIPNYPYMVVFFYTGLGIFFCCMNGRETRDVSYTIMLPISKREVVKARMLFTTLLELCQMLMAIPFAFIRQHMGIGGNAAGMDANISLFAIGFILYGAFNMVFFISYYGNVNWVGKAFLKACTVEAVLICFFEALTHANPFFKTVLDTSDNQNVEIKVVILAVSMILFAVMNIFTYNISAGRFEKIDIDC